MATGGRYILDKHGNRLQVYILDKHGNRLQVYTIGGASGSREGLGFVIEECYECVVFLCLVSSS